MDQEIGNDTWDAFWEDLSPESEIRMWDFYGGRPWILKHVPRHGKTVEAGCGLGRYVFLLNELGIDVEGTDSNESVVAEASRWGRATGRNCRFDVCDVRSMPYGDGELAGYVSLGVVEHFVEGPQEALREAARVLRPGGVAIVSTPSVSFAQVLMRLVGGAKNLAKRCLGRQVEPRPFFQYWYSPRRLARFVRDAGLEVVLSGGCDLTYAAHELVSEATKAHFERTRLFRLAQGLERWPIRNVGAQAFAIAVKSAETMHCFLCGELAVGRDEWKGSYVPICDACRGLDVARYYARRVAPRFHANWAVPSGPFAGNEVTCDACGSLFAPDPVFEWHHGFARPLCRRCLARPDVNLVASNEMVMRIWRPRAQPL